MKKINNYILEEENNEIDIEVIYSILRYILAVYYTHFKETENFTNECISLYSYICLINEDNNTDDNNEEDENFSSNKPDSSFYKSNHKRALLRASFGKIKAQNNISKFFEFIKDKKTKYLNEVLNGIKKNKYIKFNKNIEVITDIFNELFKSNNDIIISDSYKVYNMGSDAYGGASGTFKSWKCLLKYKDKNLNFYITNISDSKTDKEGEDDKIKKLFDKTTSDGSKLLTPVNLKVAGTAYTSVDNLINSLNFGKNNNEENSLLINYLKSIVNNFNEEEDLTKKQETIFDKVEDWITNSNNKRDKSNKISITYPISYHYKNDYDSFNFSDRDIRNINKDFGEICCGAFILGSVSTDEKKSTYLYFPVASNNDLSDFDINYKGYSYNFSVKVEGKGARPSAKTISQEGYNKYKTSYTSEIEELKELIKDENFDIKNFKGSNATDFYVNVISSFSKDNSTNCKKQQSKLIRNFISTKRIKFEEKSKGNKKININNNPIFKNIIENVKGDGYKDASKSIEKIIGYDFTKEDIIEYGEYSDILFPRGKVVSGFEKSFELWNEEGIDKSKIIKENWGYFYFLLYRKIIDYLNETYSEEINQMLKNYKEFFQIYFKFNKDEIFFKLVSSHEHKWKFTIGGSYPKKLDNNSLSMEIILDDDKKNKNK